MDHSLYSFLYDIFRNYGKTVGLDFCTSYGLEWSTIVGSVSMLHLIVIVRFDCVVELELR